MPLFGYGEDGLTYWALTIQLPQLLALLGDVTAPQACLRFYKPSFGRGRSPAVFGEADGLLATGQGVYHIESKWHRSRIVNGTVILEREQVVRHRIFRWYLETWRSQHP